MAGSKADNYEKVLARNSEISYLIEKLKFARGGEAVLEMLRAQVSSLPAKSGDGHGDDRGPQTQNEDEDLDSTKSLYGESEEEDEEEDEQVAQVKKKPREVGPKEEEEEVMVLRIVDAAFAKNSSGQGPASV